MKKKVKVTHKLASKHGWDRVQGCPLYHAMEQANVPVWTVDSPTGWTDLGGKRHKLTPGFWLKDYAKLLLDGKPRVIKVEY